MQMFKWGVEGGRPPNGAGPGAQPEWFYKGDGDCVVALRRSRCPRPTSRSMAAKNRRSSACISSRRTERRNDWGSPSATSSATTSPSARITCISRIRSCAPAPSGRSCAPARRRRTWKARAASAAAATSSGNGPFVTGEANMCHSLANLEYHHFKYPAHRRPGDVHLHFFGTATLSFADGIHAQAGRCLRGRPAGARRAAGQSAGARGRWFHLWRRSRTLGLLELLFKGER